MEEEISQCIITISLGHLILRKVITITATRCQILRLKCTKSFVSLGTAPGPMVVAYSVLPDPLAGF